MYLHHLLLWFVRHPFSTDPRAWQRGRFAAGVSNACMIKCWALSLWRPSREMFASHCSAACAGARRGRERQRERYAEEEEEEGG
eukprot:4118258-Pyramimonas_sp.AAC.1